MEDNPITKALHKNEGRMEFEKICQSIVKLKKMEGDKWKLGHNPSVEKTKVEKWVGFG